jgi:acyl carrier protein
VTGSRPKERTVESRVAAVWAELLGLSSVDPDDNFFELGGSSLLAASVVLRLRDELAVPIAMQDIFQARTLSEFAASVSDAVATRDVPATVEPPVPLESRPRSTTLPASFGQERLWFLEQAMSPGAAYNLALLYRLHGDLDVRTLGASVNTLVVRHDALRTTLPFVHGRPRQCVRDHAYADVEVRYVSSLAEASAAAKAFISERFDLAGGPLFRARLFRVSAEDHILAIGLHHAIADGISLRILEAQLFESYEALLAGRQPPLPASTRRYRDFAAMQQAQQSESGFAASLAFWRAELADLPPLPLPIDFPRPPIQTFIGESIGVSVPSGVWLALQQLARSERATQFMVALALVYTALERWTGAASLAVGTGVAGRPKEYADVVGFFVNTIVVRADLGGASTFRDVLQVTRNSALAAYAHQDVPFQFVAADRPVHDLATNPLVAVDFTFDHLPLQSVRTAGGLRAVPIGTSTDSVRFDVEFHFRTEIDGLTGSIVYRTDLFSPRTIRALAREIVLQAERAADHPDAPLH